MIKRKLQKPFYQQKIPGDHKLRFFRDSKSGHPFLSISRKQSIYYGHEMTRRPSLNTAKNPREGYVKLRINPNKSDKSNSYYHKSIKRISNKANEQGDRLRRYKKWTISRKDLKTLKAVDKKKIKNVRRAND